VAIELARIDPAFFISHVGLLNPCFLILPLVIADLRIGAEVWLEYVRNSPATVIFIRVFPTDPNKDRCSRWKSGRTDDNATSNDFWW